MKKPRTTMQASPRLRDAITRTDLASFNRKVFQTLAPSATYQDNWHIHAIAHHLELVRQQKIRRLIVTVPPRSMKSLLCSISFPAWLLGHDPSKRVIGVSYSSELAINLSNDTRKIIGTSWYRELFRDTKLSRDKNSEAEYQTTRMGFRIATSIEGTLTGRGGDIIIIDDPMKPIDALSDIKLERVHNAFVNTILSRLDHKLTGAIIIVMQRLHEDDLVGRLLRDQPEEWSVLNLPAIAEHEEKIEIGNGRYHVRRVGDLLHAEREPRSILDSYRAQMGSDVFAAQYQQSPVPREGAMIKRTWPRRYRVPPTLDASATVIQSWDTAAKGGSRSNYSVCTTWLYHNKRYYLLDVYREQVDYPTLKARAIAIANLHNAKVILIEDAGTGDALANELQNQGLPVIAVKPELDKRTRMSIQSVKFESGQIFLPKEASWLADFESELFSFPGGRYDDQIDSVSQALAYEISESSWTQEALDAYARLSGFGTFYHRYGFG
ncbi:MAG TPA: phage terminase large subunit [Steroidobacteraceae bacterium]|nr:phage terminase large subunit [Steroidobacteraceae bacterium]